MMSSVVAISNIVTSKFFQHVTIWMSMFGCIISINYSVEPKPTSSEKIGKY